METDICAATRRMLARGVDVPERFAFFSEKWKDKPGWDVPEILATLEAGEIDTSAIREQLEQVGIIHRRQRPEEASAHYPGE